jgi:hypothetical protein
MMALAPKMGRGKAHNRLTTSCSRRERRVKYCSIEF